MDNWKNFLYGSFAGMSGIIVSHPFDTMKTNYQEGKKILVRNLYKGILSPLIGVGLEKAVVFGVYETSRKYTNSDVISGGLSGFCASGVVTPFERIKVLLQTNQTLPSKLGLYKGFSATLSRETPGFLYILVCIII